MVERDEASPKLGIPNPSRSGNRFLEAEPAARNNRNQGKCLGTKLGALQLTAYIAGISAHPGYVEAFDEELHYSGNRVPLTADEELWDKAVEIGQFIIWLHTFGDRGHAPNNAQTLFDVESTLPLPTYDTAVGVGMPEDVTDLTPVR